MSKVLISMPYFNCKETVRDAVQSILDQSYKDFTLLVMNDGDNSSREILADITDPRLKIYDLPVNRGRYFADAVALEANPYKFFLPTDADDMCFAAGTKILTSKGQVNIEDVKVGDKVMTRKGYKKVLFSAQTGVRKVITRLGITATPNHPFITKDGVKRLDRLSVSDILHIWNPKKQRIEKLSYTEVKNITDTQSLPDTSLESTFGDTLNASHSRYTDNFGSTALERYLKDIVSTTKMVIHLITKSAISNVSQLRFMPEITPARRRESLGQQPTSNSLGLRWRNGARPKLVELYQDSWAKEMSKTFGRSGIRESARGVMSFFNPLLKKNLGSARHDVSQLSIADSIAPVYDLSVESCHEFFANNILVHNSNPHRLLRLMRRAEGYGAVFHHQKVLWRNGSTTLERTPLLMRTLGPKMRHLAHWSGIYKTKALKEIGGIHPDFRVGYDTLIVNLLRMNGLVSIITEFLYTRRVRDNSLTVAEATNYKSPHRAKARIELQRLYALCFESPKRIKEIITKSIKPETLKSVKIEANKLRKLL